MNQNLAFFAIGLIAFSSPGVRADDQLLSGTDRYDNFVKTLLITSHENDATLNDTKYKASIVQSYGGAAGSGQTTVSEAQGYGLLVTAGAFIGNGHCGDTDYDKLS